MQINTFIEHTMEKLCGKIYNLPYKQICVLDFIYALTLRQNESNSNDNSNFMDAF